MGTAPEEFEFTWKSSSEERYDTDMMARAKIVLNSAGHLVLDEWGGTSFGEWADDGDLDSDNGFAVRVTLKDAAGVADALSVVVGHPVLVNVRERI